MELFIAIGNLSRCRLNIQKAQWQNFSLGVSQLLRDALNMPIMAEILTQFSRFQA
jgi:hypothetical protein